MAGIVLYSDKTNLVLELASAAQDIAAVTGARITAVTINQPAHAQELAEKGMVVCSVLAEGLLTADTAGVAQALKQAAGHCGADLVLLSSNRRGKELAGRLAQAWGASCLTDVKGLIIENGQVAYLRNSLGGATIATQTMSGFFGVAALSPRAFPVRPASAGGKVEELRLETGPTRVRLIETRSKAGDVVDIQDAARLVVVGQGVESQEDMALVEKISQALGAEIACSKPVASDKRWLSEDRIVGLSGKVCQPELALILGVSGQVQFTVGIRDAGVIISINNDENAFMNKMADYVLLADLKDLLPLLAQALV